MGQDDEHNDSGENSELETSPIFGKSSDDSQRSQEAEEPETMPSDEPRKLASQQKQQNRVVKICKSCMVSQRDGGNFCVRCGEELVRIRSVQDTCIGDVVGDKYRIVDKIGSGGMGDVYLGLNEPIGQRVAIKFLNEKFTSDEKIVLRFLNEARSYCRVNHPNAVTLLEYGQHDDGSLYLITEYIEGDGLTAIIEEQGVLATEPIVSIGVQVCEVLSAAHNQGIIHRDLKPDNLMMISGSRGNYAVKVLDFGIAKIADDNVEGPMTETGSVFGTPEFMSPEQARGDSVDPRSDLYALGIILYYMATAELPFSGNNKLSTLNQQLNKQPLPPSETEGGARIHPDLEALILQCLEKSPVARPSHADEVAEALERIDTSSVGKGPAQAGRSMVGSDASKSKRPQRAPESEQGTSGPSDAGLDGPAADGDSVVPLGISTFDDGGDETIDLSFDDGTADSEAATAGLGDTLDDASAPEHSALSKTLDDGDEPQPESADDDAWEGRFDSAPSDDSQLYRQTVGDSGPGLRRAMFLGVVATMIVLGGVVFWTADSEDEELDAGPESPMEAASDVVDNSRVSAALEAAEALVEQGGFDGADAALGAIDEERITEPLSDRYSDIVQRASRAGNTEMQIRSAIRSHDCDEARSLLSRLETLSSGAGEEMSEQVRDCDDEPSRRAEERGDRSGGQPSAPSESVPEPTGDAPPTEEAGGADGDEGGAVAAPTPDVPEADEIDEPQEADVDTPTPGGDESADGPEPDEDVEVDVDGPSEQAPDGRDDETDDVEAAPEPEPQPEPETDETDETQARPEPEPEPEARDDDGRELDDEESESVDSDGDESDSEPEDDDSEDDVVLPPSEI